MHAVRVHEAGGPEALRYEEVATPTPGAGEVLVQLRAAALNRRDVWIRTGRQGTAFFPCIPGSDGAGVVAAVGPGVTRTAVGQEVVVNPVLSDDTCSFCHAGLHSLCDNFDIIGTRVAGTYAEYIKVPENAAVPKPSALTWEEAAALPVAALTAYHLLFTRARLGPGETVLILGIGGGVATFALQMAKFAGATAFVTSSSDDKLARAKKLGADAVINYRREDWARITLELTAGLGVDLVVETVGTATWPDSMRAVRRGGRIAICGGTTGYSAETNLRDLFWRQVTVMGSTAGDRWEFARMLDLYGSGRLRPVIDAAFPLAEANKAHQRLDGQEQFGKVVLRIPQ
ncbi:MAG: zinc-binding dehydrogenase [Dehalococcoidia bacterium]